jgi:hypothetical protein
MKRKIFFLLAVLALCLPAVGALFHPGFFPSHDGEWMVIRLSDFHRSFVSGQIPVRWAARLNYGFGYPVFNFLYPFSLYLGEGLYFFSGSFVNAIKLVFILSFLFSGVLMYLWIREVWGEWPGLISALVYVYAPYRFLDVYVRGSLGEATAFIFPPLIFWSAGRLVKKWSFSSLFIGGLAFAGLVTSHNTMAMLFTFVFVGLIGCQWLLFRRNKALWRQLAIFLLGLVLSCFFWLPALYDKKDVLLDQVTVSNFFLHFPTLFQLLVPRWGYGPSLPLSDQDTLSFQVGGFNLAIFIISAVIFGLKLWQTSKKKNFLEKNFQTFYFLLVFAASFFFMLEVSAWIWRFIPIDNLIQFPWRLLSLTTFSSAVLAGALISVLASCLIKGRSRPWFMFGLIFLLILLNYQYAKPEYFVDRGEGYYATNEGTTTVANEYLPIWVKEPPTARAEEKVELIGGEAKISNLVFNSKKIAFEVRAETKTEVQINTVYFPGWQATIDGQEGFLDYENEKGVMRLTLDPGRHQVAVEFKETPIRLLADFISFFGLVLVGGLVIKQKRKQ